MTDAKMQILALLRDNWDPSAMSFDETQLYRNKSKLVFQTGWYGRDGELPCVTVTGKNEGPYQGGATGYTALHGPTGKGMQRIDGTVTVNFVAGTWDHLDGVGQTGEDLNPKTVREEMYQHGCDILLAAQSTDETLTVAPGTGTEIEDTGDEDESTVFRTSLRVTYQYDRLPTV
ncbi:hypothetical protein [Halomarina oriensis]|uniref:Uncharacterized protein n=1 Tax=Halomarina oriensis TaxID=671145 RepID=A0A6B0GIX2_9EURY|nr:hypothetical protein [Halomarina oriensis]MWG34822.1 hypothetical protein [Halomarina oriensis]